MADEGRSSRLTLWDADFVLDWFQRNGTSMRLRDRANDDTPSVSVQVLAEVLRVLGRRPGTSARIDDAIAEIEEHFVVVALVGDHARAYAEVVDACRRSDADVSHEAWFAWQVTLHRREGHRIMTKAPQRYRGLVGPEGLA